MKSRCYLILLFLFVLSLVGQGNAFFSPRSISVEIEHSHSDGHKNHSHHSKEKHASHSNHASKDSGNHSDDSHCHKICVTVCSPIWISNHSLSLIALESREIFAADLDTYFPSAKLGSIFRPPIFS